MLQLLRPVATRWNAIYYLIKRALALKGSLVMFTNSERARNCECPPTNPIDDNMEVFFWSYSRAITLVHPFNGRKLCPLHSPTNSQNQLGILAKLQRYGRMHGARKAAELIVGALHRAHDTYHTRPFLKPSV